LWGASQPHVWEKFEKAREFARSLRLNNEEEWKILLRKRALNNPGIPGNPDKAYKDQGWNGWDDWLGTADVKITNNIPRIKNELSQTRNLWNSAEESKWLPFDEARKIVHEWGFEYEEEWQLYIKGNFTDRVPLPPDIPPDPEKTYRFVGWKGWKDWLTAPETRVEYTSFSQARDFARSIRISDQGKWRDYIINNTAMITQYGLILPQRPHLEYKDEGWQDWEDWLGKRVKYHDFKTTRKFVHSLKLKTRNDWVLFYSGKSIGKIRRTENIYAYPEIAFRNEGWNGWDDWLGTSLSKDEKIYSDIPDGAVECRCKGRIDDCPDCDGKGYYFISDQ